MMIQKQGRFLFQQSWHGCTKLRMRIREVAPRTSNFVNRPRVVGGGELDMQRVM